MHTLTLILQDNYMGDSVAQALASLTLHTLHLDLKWNKVGDSGAQALASLKEAATLHTLNLGFLG